MLKLETNYDTIQQIINDSNAVLFPMSLKQHYLKLHIAQIVEQEKELDVIRASLGELHHQFVGIESLLYKGIHTKNKLVGIGCLIIPFNRSALFVDPIANLK